MKLTENCDFRKSESATSVKFKLLDILVVTPVADKTSFSEVSVKLSDS